MDSSGSITRILRRSLQAGHGNSCTSGAVGFRAADPNVSGVQLGSLAPSQDVVIRRWQKRNQASKPSKFGPQASAAAGLYFIAMSRKPANPSRPGSGCADERLRLLSSWVDHFNPSDPLRSSKRTSLIRFTFFPFSPVRSFLPNRVSVPIHYTQLRLSLHQLAVALLEQ